LGSPSDNRGSLSLQFLTIRYNKKKSDLAIC
jgi:hypothetical protein